MPNPRRLLIAGLVLLTAVAVVPPADSEPAAAFAGAPWFEPSKMYTQNFPDPTVVRDGSTYYAYATETGGSYVPVMSSTDLKNWTARPAYNPASYGLGACAGSFDQYFNDGLPCPAAWALRLPSDHPHLKTPTWAPGVAKIGNKWMMFYTVLQSQNPDRQCISVATADSPLGPFRDDTWGPLQCDGDPGGSIDPEPFVDSNGTPWLVWKSNGILGAAPTRLWSRQLRPDGQGFATGSGANLLLATQPGWEGDVIENPSFHRAATGKLWLAYSGNSWESSRYAAGAAACQSPAGPCTRVSGSPVLASNGPQNGPGGASLFTDTQGRLRVAYHAWNAPYTSYPAFPQCAAANNCTTQGQRRLFIGGLIDLGGRLSADPIGSLDSATISGGAVTMNGWALEPDLVDAAAGVLVLVDGTWVTSTSAYRPRADIDAAFGFGPNHGFSVQVPGLSAGTHQVCAAMFNTGGGSGAAWLGCKTVTSAGAAGSNPFGALDSSTPAGPGTISMSGWAIDADSGTGPIDVHLYVDGTLRGITTSNGPRPDLSAVFGLGPNHGFTTTVSGLAAGAHTACAWAINTGGGANALIGCRNVSVAGGNPAAALDRTSSAPGGVNVKGWAIDPDTAAPIDVHVYVDGVFTAAAAANASRPDVGVFFAGYGNDHGYDVSVGGLAARSHDVCVYSINKPGTAGNNRLIACQRANAGVGPPFGSFDSVARSGGGVRVVGWGIDPDTASAIDLHVYVDGGFRLALTSNSSRPDVGAAFPGYTDNHGVNAVVPSVSAGMHTVCVFGINVGIGTNVLIGCRSVS
jgi:hypothetical protein